jgi:tetratricopeptide (TPR) repeat protein
VNGRVAWEPESGPGAYALAAVPARFAIERRAWKEAAALRARSVPYGWDRYPWAEAITVAAQGLGAARVGDVEAATRSIAELDRLEGLTQAGWWRGRIRLERDVISGWVLFQQGRADEAVERVRRAAERELASGKLPVEPGHTIFAIEQLGELLLELDRPGEALEAFRRSLEDSPRRFHSLAGAGRAAESADLQDEAVESYTALLEMGVDGSERPETAHAAKYLAKVSP